MPDLLQNGLPSSLEAEQFVLGSVLLGDQALPQAAGILRSEDFTIEKHRRIYARMLDLYARGEKIDYLTLMEELNRNGQLASVDGVAYLSALTEGMPRFENIEAYARIVKGKAVLRQTIFASQATIDDCMASGDEPGEVLNRAEERLLQVGELRMRGGLLTPREVLDAFPGGLEAFLDPTKRKRGLETGFLKFDEMTTGLHPGDLMILAGRPAMGKTAMALTIAGRVALQNVPVAIFSLEMTSSSLLTRMLSAIGRVDSVRFRSGFLGQEERQRLRAGLNRIVQMPIRMDDTSAVNCMDIHAKCRRMKQATGLGLIVIDYLQLMVSGEKAENRNQEVSRMTRSCKMIAKDLDVPVLLLSQLNRSVETRGGDHRPLLSDLRESGSIEQDSDIVAFVFREEIYKPDREDLRGLAELIVRKQRNGPTGTVDLVFLDTCTRFENRVRAGDLVESE